MLQSDIPFPAEPIALGPDRQYCVWCLEPLEPGHVIEYDGWGFCTQECVRRYQTPACTCRAVANPGCRAHRGLNGEA